MKTALLLVDIQNDFMPGGALAVQEGDQIVAIANALMPRYTYVVATQDWHPHNHGSFAANHPGKEIFETITLNELEQVLWPVHCVQETQGADFHKDLAVEHITKVVYKGTNPEVDSYSGFFDNGKAQDTGLVTILREQGIQRVDIMGLATDYCVKFTALDAIDCGFQTRLIVPGTRAVQMKPGDGEAALAAMEAAGVTLINEEVPHDVP